MSGHGAQPRSNQGWFLWREENRTHVVWVHGAVHADRVHGAAHVDRVHGVAHIYTEHTVNIVPVFTHVCPKTKLWPKTRQIPAPVLFPQDPSRMSSMMS